MIYILTFLNMTYKVYINIYIRIYEYNNSYIIMVIIMIKMITITYI